MGCAQVKSRPDDAADSEGVEPQARSRIEVERDHGNPPDEIAPQNETGRSEVLQVFQHGSNLCQLMCRLNFARIAGQAS